MCGKNVSMKPYLMEHKSAKMICDLSCVRNFFIEAVILLLETFAYDKQIFWMTKTEFSETVLCWRNKKNINVAQVCDKRVLKNTTKAANDMSLDTQEISSFLMFLSSVLTCFLFYYYFFLISNITPLLNYGVSQCHTDYDLFDITSFEYYSRFSSPYLISWKISQKSRFYATILSFI